MTGREWSGSVAKLPESILALAIEMANRAASAYAEATDPQEMERELSALCTFLRDHAYTLSEWSDAVRELYARLDEGEGVTNAQGVAMARLLRNASTLRVSRVLDPTDRVGASKFLGFVQTYADGREIHGGIDADGSVGT